ncbi:class I SAM-dependent methyltransferase [Hymenobacter ruricola]|uniref:Methyltransferase domain-containing protein n=1 Tax=Hymenobacter ruricola TaxID=2791023 RepID=A0ABS0I181_9BACT|nr:class I SAM-dependent methyltransferase [Hymenobacter ruricola]MBF9220498.1 methyltransferase domain-containing protein [Hymenobacter ruricola]
MQDIYNDRTYLANNPTWHEEDAPFKAERIRRLLGRHPVPQATVCEVGCGSGEVLVQLAAQLPGSTFTGFDISEDALAIAQRKQTDRIRFALRDLTAQSVAEPYDLLLVIDVIEHLPNYFQFLEGIAGAGRHTVFHIPLDLSLWSLLREQILIESKARVGHIHNFTEDFILSVLADYGFRVLGTLYTEPRYKRWTTKVKITHLLRRALYALSPRLCSKLLGGYSLLVLAENPVR